MITQDSKRSLYLIWWYYFNKHAYDRLWHKKTKIIIYFILKIQNLECSIWHAKSCTCRYIHSLKEFSVCRRSLFIIYPDSFQTDEIRQVYWHNHHWYQKLQRNSFVTHQAIGPHARKWLIYKPYLALITFDADRASFVCPFSICFSDISISR